MLRKLLRGVALTATVAGIGYLAIARRCVRVFERRGPDDVLSFSKGAQDPDVTILKPLCGDEPQLYENLCSFCDQDYGDFRVVFGVADATDAARVIAERVRKDFPSKDIVISVGADPKAANPKVGNLLQMSAHASGDIFVIADSDMRVNRNYLRAIVAPLADQDTGAVTCLYRASALDGFASTVGAMYVNTYFAPSVLVASQLQQLAFALGATIAVRRDVLEAIGGFDALAAHLADDYELGRLTRAAGYDVRLSRYVVENVVHEPTLTALIEHELRWARTIAAVRPLGYALSGVTFPLMWAVIYRLLGGKRKRSRRLAIATFALRIALHKAAYEALGAEPLDPLWLIPLREVLAFGIWLGSFFGRSVTWRDQRLEQDQRGQLKPRESAQR